MRHSGLRFKLHEIIFEADTTAGKVFDIFLMTSIIASVFVVMLDSVGSIHAVHGDFLYKVEWFFTILFTIEYIMRLACVGHPTKYAKSFFGVIDLMAIIPTFISVLLPGSQYLLVIRVLRVMRVFRILKVVQYVGEAQQLSSALRASRQKITVFLILVATLVIILGSFMYLIEGPKNGFTSIPRSVYWAIVTLTTVGYGDISPKTPYGMALASVIMIMGYSIIAVPTGIVTSELGKAGAFSKKKITTKACLDCASVGHDTDALYCKFCGSRL